MKAVILAGGLGTRLAEETGTKPKPMVEVGGRPLLWHIMKLYSFYGVKDFIICLGYKGYVIKEFFFNYYRHMSDFRIDLSNGDISVLNSQSEDWSITLVDTGVNTMTGGRLKRVSRYLNGETFFMTYGDGLSNVDIKGLLDFHRSAGKLATVTAVQPPGRFGVLKLDEQANVEAFEEKPSDEIGWVNGGFFVLEPEVFDYVESDSTSFEDKPLVNLATNGELSAFKHLGFWQPCDTLRDKQRLESLWLEDKPPWKIW